MSNKLKVLILNGVPPSNTERILKLFDYNHPKYNILVKYIIIDKNMYELQKLEEDVHERPSSLIIDGIIESDGAIYIATRVDPLFYLIGDLEKARKKTSDNDGLYCQASDIFMNNSYLISQLEHVNYSHICDIKMGDLVRLNDEKVISWLRLKAERISKHLSDTYEISSGTSSTFISQNSTAYIPPKDEFLRQALTFLSEYISSKYNGTLLSSYNMSASKSIIRDLNEPILDKKKFDDISLKKAIVQPIKKQKVINVKGMSSISSFFGAK